MKPVDLSRILATLEETPFPKIVVTEAIATCNLYCSMCPQPSMKRERGTMSEELFRKIALEIAHDSPDTQLWNAIMGEPMLLREGLFDRVRFAKDAGVRKVILNTNGTLIDDDLADRMHSSGLDEVIIGLDGHSEASYSAIRVGGDFHDVKGRVERLLARARAGHWETPKIVAQFIVQEGNRHEEAAFRDHWLSHGATVKIRRRLGWGEGVEAPDLTIPDSERIPCPWLIRTMSVHWSGKVAQCDADYEGGYAAGDLNTQTIKEVWQGELARRRARHWARDFSALPCARCKDWQAGISEWYAPEGAAAH